LLTFRKKPVDIFILMYDNECVFIMSSASLRRKLLTLVPHRRRLIKQLLQDQRILQGSFNRVYTRCGRANCWCAQERKGHAHTRLTWSEDGTRTTRSVPAEQIERVIELTQNYRQFRSLRRKLKAHEARVKDLLDQYETALVAEARKPLAFLGLNSKKPAEMDNRIQTQGTRKNDAM
jgi:hypothetical protein